MDAGGVLAWVVVGLATGLLAGVAAGAAWSTRRAAERVRRAEVAAARAAALLEAEQSRAADGERLGDRFRSLAADALAASTDQFLALASQRFAADRQAQVGELAQREQAVRELVEPLGRTLADVRAQLATAERERNEAQAALREQVGAMRVASEQVRSETAQLVTALRASQVRGRWG
jgi:DNA recombination protein RmuC